MRQLVLRSVLETTFSVIEIGESENVDEPPRVWGGQELLLLVRIDRDAEAVCMDANWP